jgi:uncharacterized membrane protein (UPF0127 family)
MSFRPPPRFLVTDTTAGTTVCTSGRVANTFLSRLVGLLGGRCLEPGGGLLIRPSSGVHTFGMRFAIDVVALDRRNRVLGAWSNVGPWRIRGVSLRTRSILELPAGRIHECGIAPGDQLQMERLTAGLSAETQLHSA